MQVALPLTDAEMGTLGLNLGFTETIETPGPKVRLSAIVGGIPREWTGRVTRTNSGYDRSTRTIFAYVEVEDPYGAGADNGAPIAAGLFVNVAIEGRLIENSVIVPRTALRGDDTVYVANRDDKLEIRNVQVASSDRARVVLTSGLSEGERVITSPVRGAAEGIDLAIAGGDTTDDDESTATLATVSN